MGKNRNPTPRLGPRQYDVRSDAKYERKTEPVSKGAEEGEGVSCLGHRTEEFFWAPQAAVRVVDGWTIDRWTVSDESRYGMCSTWQYRRERRTERLVQNIDLGDGRRILKCDTVSTRRRVGCVRVEARAHHFPFLIQRKQCDPSEQLGCDLHHSVS